MEKFLGKFDNWGELTGEMEEGFKMGIEHFAVKFCDSCKCLLLFSLPDDLLTGEMFCEEC